MNNEFLCAHMNMKRHFPQPRQVGSREAESLRAHLGVPALGRRSPRPRLGPSLRRGVGRRSAHQDRLPRRHRANRQLGTGTTTLINFKFCHAAVRKCK